MKVEACGQVGPSLLGDGVGTQPFRQGRLGEQIVQQLHGRLYEASYRGTLFSAANQAAQAVSVALATTYTGILLYNPLGSGINLSLLNAKYALSVAPAGIATIGLIAGWSGAGGVTTQTTKLINQSTVIGNTSSGKAIALSAATITTPTWVSHFVDGFTAAALPAPSAPLFAEGLWVIAPGGFIGIGALTAVTGLGSLVWEEVPI